MGGVLAVVGVFFVLHGSCVLEATIVTSELLRFLPDPIGA